MRRFETPPEHQGQVDLAQFRLPWGQRHAPIVVLGYSRLMWLQYYERQTMAVLLRGLESVFHYFQGLRLELLCDEMKAVIIEDGRDFGSDDDLNSQVQWWLETQANVRVHGTLKERPVARCPFYVRDRRRRKWPCRSFCRGRPEGERSFWLDMSMIGSPERVRPSCR